eukprot:1846313-Rhodomonas_salina.3
MQRIPRWNVPEVHCSAEPLLPDLLHRIWVSTLLCSWFSEDSLGGRGGVLMEDEVGWLCLPECSSMIERQTLTESRDCRSPEQNDCPYAACNMSSCEVGEYRKECGHDYPATCATCLNTIPAYSSFSGPADPPTNSTSCPYACWSGFYREPNSEACIPDGAVGGGQFGNISLD